MTASDNDALITVPPKPYCCWIGCGRDAEWHIQTVRDSPTGGVPAGPDLYSDDTQACSEHVGVLLGWQPDAVDTDQLYWHVYPLGFFTQEPAR